MNITVVNDNSITERSYSVLFEKGDKVKELKEKVSEECDVVSFCLKFEGDLLTDDTIHRLDCNSEIQIIPSKEVENRVLVLRELKKSSYEENEIGKAINLQDTNALSHFCKLGNVNNYHLRHACGKGFAEGVKMILKVVSRNEDYDYQCLLGAVCADCADTVDILIKDGNVDVNYHRKFTPGYLRNVYRYACKFRSIEVVRVLLDAGVDTRCDHGKQGNNLCNIPCDYQLDVEKMNLIRDNAVECSSLLMGRNV